MSTWGKPWNNGWPKAQGANHQGKKGNPKVGAQKEPTYTMGWDGKKVAYPSYGASSSVTSSSEAPATEVTALKDMIRDMAQATGTELTQDQQKLLGKTPQQMLQSEQKDLNKRRKHFNKERSIQERMEENDRKYDNFILTQKLLVKQERERYKAEQERLSKELEDLRNPPPDSDVELMEDDAGFGFQSDRPPSAQMEARMLQAERAAGEAQQALLMMQSQLHALFAQQQGGGLLPGQGHSLQMTPQQQSPGQAASQMPIQPATAPPPTSAKTNPPGQGADRSAKAKTGNGPATAKTVQKEHLKAKSPETRTKPPKQTVVAEPAAADAEVVDVDAEQSEL